jgi:hypothetical protein
MLAFGCASRSILHRGGTEDAEAFTAEEMRTPRRNTEEERKGKENNISIGEMFKTFICLFVFSSFLHVLRSFAVNALNALNLLASTRARSTFPQPFNSYP